MFWPSFLSSFGRREWADDLARALRRAVNQSARAHQGEIPTVEAIVHAVQTFRRRAEFIEGAGVALEGAIIHGSRSTVRFTERPPDAPGCELGDLLVLTTLRIPPGFLRVRVCFVQTKGGFTGAQAAKYPGFALSEDQLYLLSVFPEICGTAGILGGLTLRFPNLSGMLGAYGFFLPRPDEKGDLSVVSARIVRTASSSGKSVDFTKLGMIPVLEVPGWPWFVDTWSSAVSCQDITEVANAWTAFSLGELFDPRGAPGQPLRDLLQGVSARLPGMSNLKSVLDEAEASDDPSEGRPPPDDREGGLGVVHLAITVKERPRG